MRVWLVLAIVFPLTGAITLDRMAVIVDKTVVKDSDIEREIRITAYLNGEKLAFGPAERRAAAQRLIDQTILRREIQQGRYAEASDADTEALYKKAMEGKMSLSTYGISEEELRRALKWQLTVLRFISLRFKPQVDLGIKDPFETWLDEARKQVKIIYREEELK